MIPVRNSPRAFTLLEMLVVLIIVGMLSLVLMQVFSQGLMIRARMSERIQGMHTLQVREQWFRRLVFGLYRFQAEDPRILKGDSNGFSGVSLMGIDSVPGAMVPIKLKVESSGNEGSVLYQAREQPFWPLLSWRNGEAKFSYLDKEGLWHDRWPHTVRDMTEQLPQGIMLQGVRDGVQFVWFATIPTQKEAYVPPAEGE